MFFIETQCRANLGRFQNW